MTRSKTGEEIKSLTKGGQRRWRQRRRAINESSGHKEEREKLMGKMRRRKRERGGVWVKVAPLW